MPIYPVPTYGPTAPATLGVWYQNGGSALVTENTPNITPPAANRILRNVGKLNGTAQTNGAGSSGLRIMCDGGTSCTETAWFYDDQLGKWLPFGATPFTLTTAAGNNTTLNIGNVSGSQWFVQLVANTGVTALGYGFV